MWVISLAGKMVVGWVVGLVRRGSCGFLRVELVRFVEENSCVKNWLKKYSEGHGREAANHIMVA